MNNIYKVIWSKAKNCYVVASEIAKSHTKSASGSEKMGGYGKKALLALAAASAIFCGGLVNVGAVDTVHVDESGTPLTAHEVYTKDAVDTTFATKTEVNAKADNTTVTEQGTKITQLETAVGNTYTKGEVDTKLSTKADSTTVTEQGTKITQLETAVGNTYTKAEADGKFATSAALNTAKTDLEGKITANTTKIDANKTDIDDLKTKAANTGTTLNDLSDRMVVAENNITNLKDKDVELSGNIGANKTAIDQNKADITQNKNDITTINGKLTTAEGNIATNQNAIAELKTKVGTVNNGTYLDSSKTVGENLNKLNDGLVQEVADRKVADTALSGRIDANANTIAEVNQQLVNTNNHFNTELRNTNAALQAEGKARAEADAKINTKIGNIDDTRTAYVKDANSISQNLTTLDEKLQDTNDRTGGIKRNTEDTQTTIEDKVTVNKSGDVSGVKGLSAETINTTGDAKVGGALTVTSASDLKGNVILGTNAANTVTVNGKSDFKAAVEMDKGLTVTNGDTSLKKTDVDGALSVTGESSLKNTTVGGTLDVTGATTLKGTLTAEKDATFEKNVTVQNDLTVNGKLNVGEIAMENKKTDATGRHNSSTTITADYITHIGEVEKSGVTTKSSFTHTEEGSETYATKGDKTDWTETRSDVKADGVKTES